MQLNGATIDYIALIAAIVAMVSIIVYAIRKGKVGLYNAALYLVTVAEDEWGSDTGKIKFAQVYTTIKKMYPIVSLILPENIMSDIIENALNEMKRILASKKAKEEKLLEEVITELESSLAEEEKES